MTSRSEIRPGWIVYPTSGWCKPLNRRQISIKSNLSRFLHKSGDGVSSGPAIADFHLIQSLLDRLEGWIKVAIPTHWGIRPVSDLADLGGRPTPGRSTATPPALSIKQGRWMRTTRLQARYLHSNQRHRRIESPPMSVSRSSEVASQAVVRARTGRLWRLLWASGAPRRSRHG